MHDALVIERSTCPRYERGHGDRYPYRTKLRLQSGYEWVKRKENFEKKRCVPQRLCARVSPPCLLGNYVLVRRFLHYYPGVTVPYETTMLKAALSGIGSRSSLSIAHVSSSASYRTPTGWLT